MSARWKRISIVCGVIGLCCILAAGGFAIYNLYDDTRAANDLKAETVMLEELVLTPQRTPEGVSEVRAEHATPKPQTSESIVIVPERTEAPNAQTTIEPEQTAVPEQTPTPEPTAIPEAMPVVTMDGSEFVAILSIPTLDLEFAVRNEWSKPGAKKSPCRYVGSVYTNDLIICAHNYTSHFGRLNELKQGDPIILVDMNGQVYTYHVVMIDEIGKYDIEGMVSSGYDLSLFTCTIGGKARVTVRCTRDT